MLNDKVFLTYKRKRFSYQTNTAHVTEATNISSNMQRESPWVSCAKFECDADDEKPNNHHSEKSQCSPSISRYGFKESMQQHVPATKGMTQITVHKDMGPMVLRSRRVLSSTLNENISKLAASSTGNESQNTLDTSGRKSGIDYINCAERSLTALLTVHDQIGNPINLNVSLGTDGGDGSECPEVGAKMSPYSDNNDNVLRNVGSLKEHSVTQLITFSRRAKQRQDTGERMADRNLRSGEKLSFSSSCSSHVIGANFSYEGSSQKKFNAEQQVSSSPEILENCVAPSFQVEAADENVLDMANFKVDDTSNSHSEVCTGSNIKQKLRTSSDFQTAMSTCEALPKEHLAVQPVDAIKHHMYPLNTVSSNSDNNAFSLRAEESQSMLNIYTNNLETKTITFLTEERDSTTGLVQSLAPTSICQMCPEISKKSTDVPENHRSSQTSSTPCCSVIIDEENDARKKEIEWLESLENVLRERKEGIGHDVTDRRKESTPIMLNKSADQSVKVQDKAIDFVNQLSCPQKFSLAKLPYASSIEQQKAEKSTPFTDFLSRYTTSNLDLPLDLNATASSSGSYFRDKVHILDKKLAYSPNVNPSLFKHKKTEKAIAEMMMPRVRREFLSDEPRRYLNEWSEEELDFLWIGVRRHGVDNWKAILGDSKLKFSPSRFPEDLAMQWEQEQKKLFNGVLLPPPSLSKTNMSSSRFPDGSYPENPMFIAETKLSLGEVYLHNANIAKNSQFSADYPATTSVGSSTRPLQSSYSFMSSYSGATMRHKKSTGASRMMMDGCDKQFWERSGNDPKPSGLPANTNLPHWLKEVYSSRPIDMQWLPFFTAGTTTSLANSDIGLSSSTTKHCEPLSTSKDLRGRGILKRKSIISQKNSGILRIEDASALMDESPAPVIIPSLVPVPVQTPSERPALGTTAITASPENVPVSAVPNDLVVIDSEASSEETISDDQNMRSYQDSEQVD